MTFSVDKISAEAYVYEMIFTLSNRMQCVGDRRDDAVTTIQGFLVANLTLFEDYQLNLGEMAQMLGTSRQNVKKTSDLLVKKGYVDLKKDSEDGRNIRIALTDKGREYYQIREAQEAAYLEKLFEGLDEDQVIQMKNGFKVLLENIGSIERQQTETDSKNSCLTVRKQED